MKKYPISEERCGECSMCSLVTKDFGGNYLPPNECYYQCLADAEADCGQTKENPKKYTVSIAVDGRIDVKVEAGSFEEAKEKAISCFCDVDLRNMECIDFNAVNAEDEDGNAIDY